MKLLIDGAKPKDQVVFKLTQDGEEVNIYANDEPIGYFAVYNGKVSLDRYGLSQKLQESVNTDGDDLISVVC